MLVIRVIQRISMWSLKYKSNEALGVVSGYHLGDFDNGIDP